MQLRGVTTNVFVATVVVVVVVQLNVSALMVAVPPAQFSSVLISSQLKSNRSLPGSWE